MEWVFTIFLNWSIKSFYKKFMGFLEKTLYFMGFCPYLVFPNSEGTKHFCFLFVHAWLGSLRGNAYLYWYHQQYGTERNRSGWWFNLFILLTISRLGIGSCFVISGHASHTYGGALRVTKVQTERAGEK